MKWTVLGVVALTLGGCGSLYGDAITEFDKAYRASADIIGGRIAAMDKVAQKKRIEGLFYTGEGIPADGDAQLGQFRRIVCSSSDYLINERAAMGTLGVYNGALDVINQKPKEDIGSIFAAIRKDLEDPKTLVAQAAKPRSTEACAFEVTNLLRMKPESVKEFAFVPAATAATALVDATKAAGVSMGLLLEDYLRGIKASSYIKASADEVAAAFDILTVEDVGVTEWCSQMSYPFEQPCQGRDHRHTRLDGVTVAERWAALRRPWHMFLNFYATQAALVSARKPGESDDAFRHRYNAYLVIADKQQEELSAALQDYRTLSANPGAGDIARGMRKAQETLVRLANGDITAAEAFGALKDFSSRLEKIKKDLKSVDDSWSKFTATLE